MGKGEGDPKGHSRRHEPHERPLDGPDTALRGGYGWVHGSVGMAVLSVPTGMGVLMFFTTVARHSHDSTLQADYSPKCVEGEFYEVRLKGVLESGNSKPYSSKPPKGFKLTSPR